MSTSIHGTLPIPESTSHFVTVDGVRLHYRVVDGPDDALPAIFTHGGGPGSAGWNNFRLSAAAGSAAIWPPWSPPPFRRPHSPTASPGTSPASAAPW